MTTLSDSTIYLTSVDVTDSDDRTWPFMTLDADGKVNYWASVAVEFDKSKTIRKDFKIDVDAYRALVDTLKLDTHETFTRLVSEIDTRGLGRLIDSLITRHTE